VEDLVGLHHPTIIIVEAGAPKVRSTMGRRKGAGILNESEEGAAAEAEIVTVGMNREIMVIDGEQVRHMTLISMNRRVPWGLSVTTAGYILRGAEEAIVDSTGITPTR